MKTNKLLATAFMFALLCPAMLRAEDKKSLTDSIKNVSKNVADSATDTAITAKVKALLAAESDIPSLNIKVSTKDQVVYLGGNTHNTSQAHRIVEIAHGVRGVKEVDDSSLSIADNRGYLDDAMTTARVKGKILQLYEDGKIAKGYSINVNTVNGDVHMHGKVARKVDVARIEEAVHGVKNVKDIHANLVADKR